MELNMKLLAYLTGKGAPYIEAAVSQSKYLPRTVIGVGTYLLDNEGDVDLLTSKQKLTFDTFLKPLLFDVPCKGNAGDSCCKGIGLIDEATLMTCYFNNDFRCRACRESSGR